MPEYLQIPMPSSSHTTMTTRIYSASHSPIESGSSPVSSTNSAPMMSYPYPLSSPEPDEHSAGIVAYAKDLLDVQLVSSALPIPFLPASSLEFTLDGPYERIVVPSPIATNESGPIGSAAVLYATYRNRSVVLMRLHSESELPSSVLVEFENQLDLMSAVPETIQLDVVEVLGRTLHLDAHYIICGWTEDGVVHEFLRQCGPPQAHRIQRVKRTMQMVTELQRLYDERTHPEPSMVKQPPNVVAEPADVPLMDIPPDDLTFVMDQNGERKRVGHGAFASVYLGRWHGRLVAVKTSHQKLSPSAIAMIDKEVSMLHASRSPYIVRIEGTCHKDDEYCIVLEYLHHGDLFHYLEEHDPVQIPWSLRLKWMRQLSEGLRLLHARRIAHRDHKSPNCLLDADLNIKLTDFGLSNYYDDAAGPRACGTPPWMAPEQFNASLARKKKKAGSWWSRLWRRTPSQPMSSLLATDVWSLGWVFVEIMTGRRPFWKVQRNVDKEVIEILRHITPTQLKEHIPPFPDTCPVDMCDLIHACLNVDPYQRPSISQVSDAVHRIPDFTYLALSQWRQTQSSMSSMLASIDSFNHVRTTNSYYGQYMTHDETHQFEEDMIRIDTIRPFLLAEELRAASSQPTYPDLFASLPLQRVDLDHSRACGPESHHHRLRAASNAQSRQHSRTPSPGHEQKEDDHPNNQHASKRKMLAGKYCSSQIADADLQAWQEKMHLIERSRPPSPSVHHAQ